MKSTIEIDNGEIRLKIIDVHCSHVHLFIESIKMNCKDVIHDTMSRIEFQINNDKFHLQFLAIQV